MRTCAHAYSKQTHKQTNHNDRVCYSWKVEKCSRIHSCLLFEVTQTLASVSQTDWWKKCLCVVVKGACMCVCESEDLQNKNKKGSQELVLSMWACMYTHWYFVCIDCIKKVVCCSHSLRTDSTLNVCVSVWLSADICVHCYAWFPGQLVHQLSWNTYGKAARHCFTQQQLTRLLSPQKHSSAGLSVCLSVRAGRAAVSAAQQRKAVSLEQEKEKAAARVKSHRLSTWEKLRAQTFRLDSLSMLQQQCKCMFCDI